MRAASAAITAFAFMLVLVMQGAASAATFPVTKEPDTNDGFCDADCSLREAVNAANALDGDDLITVPAGNYALSGAAGEDLGASGDLDVGDANNKAEIVGAGSGPGGTTIDANDVDRVFDVLQFAQLELRGVRVLDGNGVGGAVQNLDGDVRIIDSVLDSNQSTGDGGAINSFGTGRPRLIIENSELTGNTATSDGGAIANGDDSQVVITNSTLSGNSAGGLGGGAIWSESNGTMTIVHSLLNANTTSGGLGGGAIGNQNDSTLTIVGSTISGNQSTGDQAGAIFSQNQTTVTIAGSTVSRNRTLGTDSNDGGGGLWAQNSVNVNVVDSTFTGNHAARHGGAFYTRNFVWLTILNSTIAGNDADQNGGAIYSESQTRTSLESSTLAANTALAAGGGIFNDTTLVATPFLARNTILATNTASGAASDCAGPAGGVTSLGHNLDGAGQCGLGAAGDIAAGAAGLGALASNGGPTQTMALLAGSQAIDAGDSSACPAADQRGVARPQGATCDIGAYELVPPPQPTTGTPTAAPTGQRAAALKKCGKIKNKKKRKKCKKRARRLPV